MENSAFWYIFEPKTQVNAMEVIHYGYKLYKLSLFIHQTIQIVSSKSHQYMVNLFLNLCFLYCNWNPIVCEHFWK